MHRLALSVLVATATASMSQAAPASGPSDALLHKAEACIRAQGPAAAAVAKNPNEAVTFLVEGLCALEVQHFEVYQRNVDMLANWRATPIRPSIPVNAEHPSAYEKTLIDQADETRADLVKVTVDPDTGEMIPPAGFKPPFDASSFMITAMNLGTIQHARFRSVAAAAVLAADQAGVAK